MKRGTWVLLGIAAVVISVALGLYLGSSGGGSKRPPKRDPVDTVGKRPGQNGLGSMGPDQTGRGPSDPASTDPKPNEPPKPEDRPPLPTVTFTVEPAKPTKETPVTFTDTTEPDKEDQILVSEWRVEGPGLTNPVTAVGQTTQITFPSDGDYEVSHRINLLKAGLTDWVTQTVTVKLAELEPMTGVTDATGAVEVWTEKGQVRFRIHSEALGEPEGALIEGLTAKLRFASGAQATFGPGNYRMDTALVLSGEEGRIDTLTISGTLPSGRQWEQTFRLR